MRHETICARRPSEATFDYLMSTRGWVHFPATVPAAQLAALRTDVAEVYARRRAVQVQNGVAGGMEGVAHHVLGGGDSLDDFVNHLPLADWIARRFAGKFILLNFGATLHPPGATAYTSKPHRDVRAWSPAYPLSLNMLVMLDDFTLENGATLLLSGSQHLEALPPREVFEAYAEPVTGRAGDVILFDSLVVHAAAPNRSSDVRRALTLCFGRPFMKPHMEWTDFLPAERERALTPLGRQLLGYDARAPRSVEDFYQPPDRWTFKADQI